MSTQDFLGLEGLSPAEPRESCLRVREPLLTSPERIVPISASGSLHASADPSAPGVIPTGLPRLDEAICRDALDDLSGSTSARPMGVLCGHVTEIFGPPGAGKTSMA